MTGGVRGCHGMTKQGVKCGAPALVGERLCLHHHPDHEAARVERNLRGGRGGERGRHTPSDAPPPDLTTGRGILDCLTNEAIELQRCEVSATRAKAVASLASAAGPIVRARAGADGPPPARITVVSYMPGDDIEDTDDSPGVRVYLPDNGRNPPPD